MKGRGLIVVITLLFTVVILSTLVQCDHDGMARVTIHIQNEAYAGNQDSIIDKFFNLFSTKAFAWEEFHGDGDGILTLTISGNSISTIVTTIPPTQSSYSTELPANNEITFRLTFYNSTSQFDTFGGQETVTLNMGDNDIQITLIPITIINWAVSVQAPNGIGVGWDRLPVSGYNLYRSSSENGTYIKVNQSLIVNPVTGAPPSYNDDAAVIPFLEEGQTYFYRVSAFTPDGKEGLFSDAVSTTYIAP